MAGTAALRRRRRLVWCSCVKGRRTCIFRGRKWTQEMGEGFFLYHRRVLWPSIIECSFWNSTVSRCVVSRVATVCKTMMRHRTDRLPSSARIIWKKKELRERKDMLTASWPGKVMAGWPARRRRVPSAIFARVPQRSLCEMIGTRALLRSSKNHERISKDFAVTMKLIMPPDQTITEMFSILSTRDTHPPPLGPANPKMTRRWERS